MNLSRRHLLQLGTVGTLAVAGCLDRGGEQPPDQPTVSGETITTTETDCGGPDDETATVTQTDAGITVEGATRAPNPCHEATLQTLLEGTSLSVTIDVEPESPDEPCIECVGRIDYTAEIELSEDTAVETVTVEHEAGEFSESTEL